MNKTTDKNDRRRRILARQLAEQELSHVVGGATLWDSRWRDGGGTHWDTIEI